ncbi:Na+/H+ antiporter NhaA [Acetobacteraceae bacterium]|nr:Na+/H+ antiporter NhaA [Acetobacteraceae bacterium]
MLLYPLKQLWLAITEEMLLGLAVLTGILLSSSALSPVLAHLLQTIPFPFFPLTLKSWLNEGLLSLFFAILGVELRADFEVGPLKDWRKALFPLSAAIAALIIPVLLAVSVVYLSPYNEAGFRGWGIPAASAPVLTMPLLTLAAYLPSSIKTFVRAVLVFDDIFAVAILICFYGNSPHLLWLAFAGILSLALALIGQFIKTNLRYKPYAFQIMLPIAFFLWITLCKAGTPASMAGLILGVTLPHRPGHAMIRNLAHPVAWLILPLFAICNTAIDLRSFSPVFFESATFLGPLVGFALGKPIGIFLAIFLCEKAGLKAPWKKKYRHWLIGAVMSCALGFTVSLLMTQLAYDNPLWQMQAQAGIGLASVMATLIAVYFLKRSDKKVMKEKKARHTPKAKHGMA